MARGNARSVSSDHSRVVRYTLTAAEQTFQIGTKKVKGKGYNGSYAGPTLHLRPGDTLDLKLVNRLAEPTNPVWKVWTADHLVMPPGKRFEVLVQGAKAGTYTLKTRAYSTGPGGDRYPETKLATVVSSGKTQRPAALPTGLVPKTLRWGYLGNQPIARQRTTTFSESPDGNNFFIDNKQFNHNRIDVAPNLGTTEQWTVHNVMSINGRPYNANGQQDTIALPYNGGQVVIRDRFDTFTGKFVYHCHILDHEDQGMMLVVDVVGPQRVSVQPPSRPAGGGEILISGEAH